MKEYADRLVFEREHNLGVMPLELDTLVIKNNDELVIKKNIGRIFRKYNIMEYKSPTDYLSIDNYYKTISYVYLYKSESKVADGIKIGDISVSFVIPHYPAKLIKHLEDNYGYRVERADKGIYYLVKEENNLLPTQFIVTPELDHETNKWIAALTNDLNDSARVHSIVNEYLNNSNNELYQAVMKVVVNANPILNGGDLMRTILDEIHDTVTVRDILIKEQDARLQEQKTQLQEQVTRLQEQDTQLQEQKTQLQEQKTQLQEQNDEIARLKRQIAQLMAEK